MEPNKNYFPEIDIVKGIAILLVILGHSICQFPYDLNDSFPKLAYIARSFEMPLFFMASGFLFSYNSSTKDFFSKKAKRIIIPFFTFATLTVTLRIVFSSITRSGELDIVDGVVKILTGQFYWFLYTLTLFMIIAHYIRNAYILVCIALASIILYLNTNVENVLVFTMGRFFYNIPFFILGLFIRQHYHKLKPKNEYTCWICFLLSTGIFAIVVMTKDLSRIVDLYMSALFGSLMIWNFSIIISKWNNSFLKHFGRYSLQYYTNHLIIMLPIFYFAGRLFTPPHFAFINNLGIGNNSMLVHAPD